MPASIPPPVLPPASTRAVVAAPLPISLDDRWAAWLAREREREEETRQEIRTALILMGVAIAFAGAIAISFGGQP